MGIENFIIEAYEFKTNPSLQDLTDIYDIFDFKIQTDKYESFMKAYCDEKVIIIIELHEVIGYIAYSIESEITKIELLEIRESYRRQTLGTMLVDFVINLSKDLNLVRIERLLLTEEIKSFWDKLGFAEVHSNYKGHHIKMVKNIV